MSKSQFNTKSDNPNYLAKIFRLGPVTRHPNADKLGVTVVDGCSVITSLDAQEGNLYVYFPIESTINKDYLSFSNSFQDKELNKDKEKKGFFVKTGRVRAIKLRGMVSEGYIVPARDIENWLIETVGGFKAPIITEELSGTQFDHYGDIKICEKYTIPIKQGTPRNLDKKVKRESKLVENQFRLSLDLEHLKRNLHKIKLDDIISISYKLHGCNTSLGKVLCKRPLSFVDKIAKLFGVKVQEMQYDLVYASRNVIKNQYADKQHNSYYKEDVWSVVANKYKEGIKDGITLYGEICGQMTSGGWIQKDYDYGLPLNTCDLWVFRITYTSSSGDVYEFTTSQIKRYCEKMGLKMVPLFYYGTVYDFIWKNKQEFSFFDGEYFDRGWEDNWREEFLKVLMKKFTEKDCFMCKNKLPEEGVVIAVENDIVEPFKLKSLRFLERETKLLDAGETNVEDQEVTETV